MLKTGRILLVESQEDLRRRIDHQLEKAGHDVASVPDEAAAARLLEDGLEPDVLVAEAAAFENSMLSELAPTAATLLLDRTIEESTEFMSSDGVARCAAAPGDVARRVEEILLGRRASSSENAGERCLEVASRLTSSLREARTSEDRVETLIDVFDSYFGVKGSLVVRRSAASEDWVQASRGIDDALADAIFREISRRAAIRALRPFLTRITTADGTHEIACVPVAIGEPEVTVALRLEWSPAKAALRQALANLVGAAVRSAHEHARLDESEALLAAHATSFESLLLMSRDFTRAPRRAPLCERILAALGRELPMRRSAVYLLRDGDGGILDLQASSGFAPLRLDRLGLSRHHGVGAAGLRDAETKKLVHLAREGAAAREIGMLLDVGLEHVVPILDEGEPLGLLVFGGSEYDGDLRTWDLQILRALVGSAAIALRNLHQLERLEGLSSGAIRGLVEAIEMAHPLDRGHADRVASGARLLGTALSLEGKALRSLALAALLHDVGKIGTGVGTLPGSVASDLPEERRVRLHPILGSQILSRSKPDPDVIQAVEQHHERYDGAGHPYGLRGEGIHLFGRILAIVDAYDRFVHRPKDALSPKEALQRLQRGAGLLFDPGLVALFSAEIDRNPEALTETRSADWFLEVSVSA